MINWCGYEWECTMGGRLIHPGQPWMWYSDKNVSIDKNNVMHLSVTRDPKDIKYWDGRTYHPSMAVGTVRTHTAFRYGTFSAEIKLPKGYNLWPAFWMSGEYWWPPEIDIIECWSGNNDYFKWQIAQPPYICPSWRVTTNVHYNDKKNGELVKDAVGSRNIPWLKQSKNPTENFIEYKCVWMPDSIKFYANGHLVRKVGKAVAHKLTENLKDERFDMDVIFDLWCENPDEYKVSMETEMLIKNFKYTPYEK